MGVTRQVPATSTGGLVFELKAKSEEKGEDTFEKRFAVTQQLKIGRFGLKINRDGPVFTGLTGCGLHGHPQVKIVTAVGDQRCGQGFIISRGSATASGLYH
jgi:hypothetical protein